MSRFGEIFKVLPLTPASQQIADTASMLAAIDTEDVLIVLAGDNPPNNYSEAAQYGEGRWTFQPGLSENLIYTVGAVIENGQVVPLSYPGTMPEYNTRWIMANQKVAVATIGEDDAYAKVQGSSFAAPQVTAA